MAAPVAHPALALEFLRLYGAGSVSAADVQRMAAAAWADGWGRGSTVAERLKSAGANGTLPGNVARDISRVGKSLQHQSPHVYKFMVPGRGWKEDAPSEKLRPAYCHLPHEIINKLQLSQHIERHRTNGDDHVAPL